MFGSFRNAFFCFMLHVRGKAMANYPYELAQDAAYQSYTSRLTELWSLPKPAQGLNTYNNNNNNACKWVQKLLRMNDKSIP